MPGGAGKAKRACRICKAYGVAGNSKERKTHSEKRRLGRTRRLTKKVTRDEW